MYPRTLLHGLLQIFFAFLLVLFFFPYITFAALDLGTFVPLTAIPGVTPGAGVAGYINALFLIIIGLGGMFAVIKIAIAGVKYMLSDVVTDKSEAKKDITGALLGLLILLAGTVVLLTIYPGLTNIDVLRNAEFEADGAMAGFHKNPQGEVVPDTGLPERAAEEQFTKDCREKGGKILRTTSGLKCQMPDTPITPGGNNLGQVSDSLIIDEAKKLCGGTCKMEVYDTSNVSGATSYCNALKGEFDSAYISGKIYYYCVFPQL